MKKKKWAVLTASTAAVVFTLAACANTTNIPSSSSELVVPETSSKELLASSLEYLLKEKSEQEETKSEEMSIEELRKEEVSGEIQTEAEQAEDIQQAQVTVYYGNSGSLELKCEDAVIEQLTPENLIDFLAKHNIVSLDTKVNSFEAEEDAGGKILKLDLSGSFKEYLKTMSENGEKVILASVTNTFLETYGAERIQITVEGDPLETSHGSYEEPMGYIRLEEE